MLWPLIAILIMGSNALNALFMYVNKPLKKTYLNVYLFS